MASFVLVFLACPVQVEGPGASWASGFRNPDGSNPTATVRPDGPLLLVFWSTWSTPCLPLFDGVQGLVEEMDVFVVRVGGPEPGPVSPPEELAAIEPVDDSIVEAYEIETLPTVLLIDKAGDELERFEGYSPALVERLRLAVESAVSGENPETEGED